MRIPLSLIRILLFVSAIILILCSCRKKQGNEDEEGRTPPKASVAVKVAMIIEGDAVSSVTDYGRTDALKKEKVYAPIAGRIVSLKAFEGSGVKKGEVIALIQSKESQAAILGAETMIQSATTPEQKAEAERTLKLARSTQNTVSVLAKFDGIVSTRNVNEGELVVDNSELLTIIDLSTIDFLADVSLRDLPSIHLNQRATIRFQALANQTYPAVVEAINPQTDIQSQTVKVRMKFLPTNNALRSNLRTDMMGTATIVTALRPHSLFVPKTALLRNDEENTYSIVTMTPDSLALRIPVIVGIISDSTAEIHGGGIHPGMLVITEGNYTLADSTRVFIARQGNE